ncbi:hypothetical protein [Wenjunlia tyrosinilytica]|uniref:hypothetical protein n=1 Tax=Wenjunlia tyrosinilytica TaxID=1544741 RepID=UPI0016660A14|nr:hypothetical protein [Wenjunlia tyrosinilytica]
MATRQETLPWSRIAGACPKCGHRVREVVVGRRKVLGAFVPEWAPGPCRNPRCPRSRQR